MPSPSHTPAQIGRLRAHDTRPSDVNASTMKSQLIRPVVITAGARAIIMASQGRDNCRCAHNSTMKKPNSSTALTPAKMAAACDISLAGTSGPM